MTENLTRSRREWLFFLITASLLFLAVPFLGPLCESICNRNVYLPAETPYFDEASPDARQLGILEKGGSRRSLEWKHVPYLPKDFNNGRWFPAEYLLTFHKIQTGEGREAWASPDLFVFNGKTEIVTVSQQRHLPAALASLCGVFLTFLFGSRILRKPFGEGGGGSTEALVLVLYLVAFLKQFLLAAWLYFSSSTQIRLTDESCYFRIAQELFGTVTEPWNYTIGYPLLISPLLSLTGISREGMQQASEWISAWNGYLVLPLCTVMLALILRHFCGSLRRTFWLLCIFLAIPFLIAPYENFPMHLFSIWIDLPWRFLSYKSYYTQIWTGWNALSDPASLFFVMLCILLGIFRIRGLSRMILISALFSFACLIRINNIFFAPLIAFLFWEGNKELFREKPARLLRDAFCCLCAFLCVFLPQFLINMRDFASPFTWPYVLHDTASQGFRLSALMGGGMTYFVKCNLLLFSFGTAAILFMKEKVQRILFILWVFPLSLFFSGYVCFPASPIRFIFPVLFGLAAAIGCGAFWNVSWNRRTAWGALLPLFLLILAYNPYLIAWTAEQFYGSVLPPVYRKGWVLLRYVLLGVCLIALLPALWKKYSVPLCCWIVGFTLFFLGCGELLWGVSLLLLVYGIILFCDDVRRDLFSAKNRTIR